MSRLSLLLIALASLLQPGCAVPPPGPLATAARTFVYRCEGEERIVARVAGDKAWLLLPGRTAELARVPSASGARFTAGDIVFWSKGDEATVQAGGRVWQECVSSPVEAVWEDARLRGVEFRAVGNEPGWSLEISPQGLNLAADYGQRRLEFPAAEPEFDLAARRTLYRTEQGGRRLTVTAVGRVCRDTMSGETFPTVVTAELDDGTVLRGCGRPLR